MPDLRTTLENQLQNFQPLELRPAALGLLDTLGYASDKTIELDGSPEAFLEQFNQNPESTRFNEEKALSKHWKEIQLLFQLTDQELGGQVDLFQKNEVEQSDKQSYLFFAVKLSGNDYARGKLADITRQLNRLFPMPVMVFFEYDAKLSIAVINRRPNKRDQEKDVLGKVTLIQGIDLANPHRGHLDILASFSVPELKKKNTINSFDTLHAAWEEVFNVKLLNEKFYREISNWYFWAMQHVHFPFDILEYDAAQMDKSDLFKDKEKLREHDAKNLIRMLTRLLFVWFIKEKGLVPDSLFDQQALEKELLKTFDAEAKETNYYKAILQNLFFATLNQTRGKRAFRLAGQNQNATQLMRYKKFFQSPEDFIECVEAIVPFMNGGLFECLDKPHPTLKGPQGGDVILYEDGFSDRKDNALKMPDFLFFGEERVLDLSGAYGDNKRKKETVRGIIRILKDYRFTIVENTPIEEEIALDPELLGKVFENLLASYNPETKTTARKQTGSFYTPRTIVDYMVDESLKAYLMKALTVPQASSLPQSSLVPQASSLPQSSPQQGRQDACDTKKPLMPEEDAKEGLEILFAYTEKEHAFTDAEKNALITAIDACKILDPACGSGAFPMGILHKLVFILSKLDPGNERWKQRQLDKLDSAAMREDLEQIFEDNDDDYGRKLYLIENCIYGVDIQSIATQVSKLRFFISLIVDQKVDPTKDDFGVRPLPNLEIKFATADTLIQIEKPKVQGELFDSETVQTLEKELKKVRHNLFNAKTPGTKRKHRQRDKELREEIAAELEANGWSNASARQLAGWDPYDQNASSAFFDPEWMFDLKGFDIVIGNPPYIRIQTLKKTNPKLLAYLKEKYPSAKKGSCDIYVVFVERGMELLRQGGNLSYILPHKFFNANYGEPLREIIADGDHLRHVVHFGDQQIFPGATNYVCLLFCSSLPEESIRFAKVDDLTAWLSDGTATTGLIPAEQATSPVWNFVVGYEAGLFNRLSDMPTKLGDVARIFVGIQTSADDVFIMNVISEDSTSITLKSKALDEEWIFEKNLLKPIISGTDVRPWTPLPERQFVLFPYRESNGKVELIPIGEIEAESPRTAKYLKENKERLEGRESGKLNGALGWYGYIYLKNMLRQNLSKLCVPRLVDHLQASPDFEGSHVLDNVDVGGVIYSDSDNPHDLGYLLALLNSRLFRWYFPKISAPFRGGFFSANKQFLSLLPFRGIDFDCKSDLLAHDSITELSRKIVQAKQENIDVNVSALEAEIDQLVYKLYDLTPEEVAIVERRK